MITKFKRLKKRKKKAVVVRYLIIAIIVIVASFFIYSSWKIMKKRGELRSQIQELEQKIQGLEKNEEDLKNQVSESAEQSFWEKKAREQGYKSPDEEVAVILWPDLDESEQAKTSPSILEKTIEKIKFW